MLYFKSDQSVFLVDLGEPYSLFNFVEIFYHIQNNQIQNRWKNLFYLSLYF